MLSVAARRISRNCSCIFSLPSLSGVVGFGFSVSLNHAASSLASTLVSGYARSAAIQFAIRKGGFAAYKIAVIVANAIARALLGRGLSLAANAALTKWMSIFAGPIGWAVTVLWTVFDIAGPAYRVTIPCVVQIAYMRAKREYAAELAQPQDISELLDENSEGSAS